MADIIVLPGTITFGGAQYEATINLDGISKTAAHDRILNIYKEQIVAMLLKHPIEGDLQKMDATGVNNVSTHADKKTVVQWKSFINALNFPHVYDVSPPMKFAEGEEVTLLKTLYEIAYHHQGSMSSATEEQKKYLAELRRYYPHLHGYECVQAELTKRLQGEMGVFCASLGAP